MPAREKGTVIYPDVVAVVNGIKCRALLNTGAGSSYVSAELTRLLQKRPSRTEYRRIDMMMSSTTQKVEIYDVTVADFGGKFEMKTQMSKVDKSVLLSVPNPDVKIQGRQEAGRAPGQYFHPALCQF